MLSLKIEYPYLSFMHFVVLIGFREESEREMASL